MSEYLVSRLSSSRRFGRRQAQPPFSNPDDSTMAKKEANSTSTDPARYILDHSAVPTFSFAFAEFLKQEYRFGLDPNRPRCRAFLQGHCPLGNSCPDQHVASTPFNE